MGQTTNDPLLMGIPFTVQSLLHLRTILHKSGRRGEERKWLSSMLDPSSAQGGRESIDKEY